MQFIIIGLDGKDSKAIKRRMAVRDEHIALGDELFKSGNMWYGASIRDDNDKMIGSMLVMDFESKDKLNAWLEVEPYVTGKVWKSISIHKANVRDPWQFNRSKDFFENKKKLITS